MWGCNVNRRRPVRLINSSEPSMCMPGTVQGHCEMGRTQPPSTEHVHWLSAWLCPITQTDIR